MKKIAIVGGGIIGCSLAFRLAQAGAGVTVIEKGEIGREASFAGAGMLAPGGEFQEDSLWARRGIASLKLWAGFAAELEALTGIEQDYRQCGALELAYTEQQLLQLEGRLARQKRMGIPFTKLSAPSQVPGGEAVAAQGLLGCWHYPEEAVVDPRPALLALRKACQHLGVEFVTQNTVDPAQPSLPGFATTIWATGAWGHPAGTSDNGQPAFAEPVKGHLIRYTPLPGAVPGPILRCGHIYALQRAHGGFVVGSDEAKVGFSRGITPGAGEALHAAMTRMVPALQGQGFAEIWSGLRPGTTTGEPIVGPNESGDYWLSLGHFRNGILLAPENAGLLTRQIADALSLSPLPV